MIKLGFIIFDFLNKMSSAKFVSNPIILTVPLKISICSMIIYPALYFPSKVPLIATLTSFKFLLESLSEFILIYAPFAC